MRSNIFLFPLLWINRLQACNSYSTKKMKRKEKIKEKNLKNSALKVDLTPSILNLLANNNITQKSSNI